MGRLFAMISHKGGTGRTTATANIAYQLTLRGKSVCCVDLDLTSPTFGAVLGMKGYEQGAPIGVHDFLSPTEPALARDAPGHLLDVWAENPELGESLAVRPGDFKLLPGKNDQDRKARVVGPKDQGERLADLFATLVSAFAFVLVDVRSGTSDVVEGVLHAVNDHNCQLTSWIVFFRWTPQHLVGAHDLCLRLSDKGAPVRTVRTAFTERNQLLAKPKWFQQQHDILEDEMADRLRGFSPIADIPFEDLLRWKECVITDDLVTKKVAAPGIVEGYKRLARKMAEANGSAG
jgi:hypothetical protein